MAVLPALRRVRQEAHLGLHYKTFQNKTKQKRNIKLVIPVSRELGLTARVNLHLVVTVPEV